MVLYKTVAYKHFSKVKSKDHYKRLKIYWFWSSNKFSNQSQCNFESILQIMIYCLPLNLITIIVSDETQAATFAAYFLKGKISQKWNKFRRSSVYVLHLFGAFPWVPENFQIFNFQSLITKAFFLIIQLGLSMTLCNF